MDPSLGTLPQRAFARSVPLRSSSEVPSVRVAQAQDYHAPLTLPVARHVPHQHSALCSRSHGLAKFEVLLFDVHHVWVWAELADRLPTDRLPATAAACLTLAPLSAARTKSSARHWSSHLCCSRLLRVSTTCWQGRHRFWTVCEDLVVFERGPAAQHVPQLDFVRRTGKESRSCPPRPVPATTTEWPSRRAVT
jgi:hypothetical protein